MKPGIYNISAKEYHALSREIVSNSYLSRLDSCPAKALIKQEDTPTLIFGRAAHSYILEGPQAFFKEFAVMEEIPCPPGQNPKGWKNTNIYQEAKAAFLAATIGKTLISEEDFITITEMDKAVKSHPFAKELLAEGVSEQTVIWQDEETGIMCKCRPDRTPDGNKGVLVDLKTTDNAELSAFYSSAKKYGYFKQASMYLEGVSFATGVLYDAFAFIVVEKDPPYRVEVYILARVEGAFSKELEEGYQDFHRLLRLEKECRQRNFWPHYKNAGAEDLIRQSSWKETHEESIVVLAERLGIKGNLALAAHIQSLENIIMAMQR